MSSPVMTPRGRRSMAGPVVLIVLGIVFLMGTMGILHWSGLGHLFARFWPALLILWGAIKLVEYRQAQRDGVRPPGIGAGGVLLLIVLICFGLASTQATHVDWGAVRDQIDIDDADFTLFGNSYNYDDALTQAWPAGASLRVVDDHGAVTVNVSDDNQIKVAIRKKVVADSQQAADKYNNQAKPQITVSGNTVTLNANTGGAPEHAVTTDLEVSVPRQAAVAISGKHGDARVTERNGDVEVTNQRGEVSLEDINGNATLNLDHSSLRAERISGDFSIEGRANDVAVSDVKGAVRLHGEFMESVKLARIGKSVSFKSARTDLEFTRLEGDLELDSGDLRADSLSGPLHLQTRAKDIRLEGVSGDVRVHDENGDVEVGLSSPGNVQIQNRKGDIRVTLPPAAAFQLDAQARNGEIESDFTGLKIENVHDQAVGSGSVGTGGPRLQITNEHGNIEIRRGAVAVATPPAPPVPPKAPHLPAPKSKAVMPAEQ